jgi:hypothetical protein
MTAAFAGTWLIERSIIDDETGKRIDCTGVARLRPSEAALAYDEDVSFELDGKRIRATRAYRFTSGDNMVVATFTDGAPFFALALDATGCGMATHRCGEDLYTLSLRLRDSSSWETRWNVTGTKRLRIITRYHAPASGASHAP